MKKYVGLFIILVAFFSCQSKGVGKLSFYANGEDFVKMGFVDKDGWTITFDKVLLNLQDISAYSDSRKAGLKGAYSVNLKDTVDTSNLVLVDTKTKVTADNYQGLKFSVKRFESGEFKNYSIIMSGKAKRGLDEMDFLIKLDEEVEWDCKDGYVGDIIKGIVEKDATGEAEMTFHFDHIFGDNEAAEDDHINTGSVGFNYFAQFAGDGSLDIDQKLLAEKTSKEEYKKFLESIWSLGHSGEGHCELLNTSTKL